MPSRPTWALRLLIAALIACSLLSMPTSAKADAAIPATTTAARSWCGPGFETLPGDVCYIDGRTKAPRRTLVIWLHGVIAKNTNWSWNHERMLQRVAKASGIEMLFPRAPETE